MVHNSDMNEDDTPSQELPVEAQAATPADNAQDVDEPQQDENESLEREPGDPRRREASEPAPRDPRRRLRELLAIPDRDRPDHLWDELIELEIQLAPGNRVQPLPGEGGGARRQEPGRQGQGQRQDQGRRPDQGQRQDAAGGAKPPKRFFKKPKRGPGAPPKPSNS